MQEQPPPDDERQDDGVDWTLWPPSPKVQIILIAAAFGLFNLLLLVIWAVVFMTQSG
jgi:hypothetical protein